jgi:predicted N-acetyltransferase YhbS
MEIRPIDVSPAGLARTAVLLKAVFPEATHIDAAYLDRLYNGNPVGPTTGLAAFSDEGELVAHYLMIPVRSLIHGEVEDGIWPFQLAVHPAHRGRSVFTALVEGSRELMEEAGYSYIVGVTNAQSAPIYQKRFGCQLICQLDVKIGVGPAPEGRPLADPEYRRVWNREGVAWRCGLPARPYRVVRRAGRARLYARTGRWGIWCEVASLPEGDVPPDLPRFAARSPLRLWIGTDPGRDWSRSLYVDVPRRLRASPLHLTFGDFSGRGRRFDPRRVEFQVFDFDAY